jgi:hypothetical protein
MPAIEAQRASILVPHDHRHNMHMSACWSLDEPGKRSSAYFTVAASNVAADDAHSNQAGVGF